MVRDRHAPWWGAMGAQKGVTDTKPAKQDRSDRAREATNRPTYPRADYIEALIPTKNARVAAGIHTGVGANAGAG
jgi:hypothetical protein